MLGHDYITKPEVTRPYLTYFFYPFQHYFFRKPFQQRKNQKRIFEKKNQRFKLRESSRDARDSISSNYQRTSWIHQTHYTNPKTLTKHGFQWSQVQHSFQSYGKC